MNLDKLLQLSEKTYSKLILILLVISVALRLFRWWRQKQREKKERQTYGTYVQENPEAEARRRGEEGERTVALLLGALPDGQYRLFHDVMLPSAFGLTQIDHVVLSIYGIFVIETKNYRGWITGGVQSENWTEHLYRKQYHFRNPLLQNYAHIKALMELLEIPSKEVLISIVAFSDEADLRVQSAGEHVIHFSQLQDCILSYEQMIFSEEEIDGMALRLSEADADSPAYREAHRQQLQMQIGQREAQIAAGICPRCGKALVRREGKYRPFYGCSGYPKCRFTSQISEDSE